MKKKINKKINKKIRKSVLVAGVAGLMMLFGGNAMAFSVGLGFSDLLADRSDVTSSGGGPSSRSDGSGLRWWALFQDRLPSGDRDTDEYDGGDDRCTGDWFGGGRSHCNDRDYGDIIGKHNVEQLGIDRQMRIAFFKKRLFKDFLLGWKLGRWLKHSNPSAAVPLPAGLLLFASAFAGLLPFARRTLRRKQELITG